MNEKDTRVQIPQNVVKQYDWIFKTYQSSGLSLADGFQKDGIQNSAGARKADNWTNWSCSINIVNNKKGKFLIIEDYGTYGLTGPNLPVAEIQKKTDTEKPFQEDMRLARFSSMYNSGGNKKGGGLFGVGKAIYSVASESYEYYFDSLRDDGIYVANSNFKGTLYPQAFENDKAKKYILNQTDLTPIKRTGTRIIIKNPHKELINSIEKGEIVPLIQQTWWRIINRMDDLAGIFINGKRINPPKFPTTEKSYELPAVDNYKGGYRVKHMEIHVLDKESKEWDGIYYYRKGMRIGQIDIKDIPSKLQNKIWGYIEVEQDWEDELAKIEDSIHNGVQKNKKNSAPYAILKNYVNEKFRNLMIEWGYSKDKENEDKKLKEELQKIAEEVQDLFEYLKFDDLGKGPKKTYYDIRWQDVHYPNEPSVEVTTGNTIRFGFKIKNRYVLKKIFKYSLKIVNCSNNTEMKIIEENSVPIDSNQEKNFIFSLNIDQKVAAKGCKNNIELHVSIDGQKEKIKQLPFYYDVKEPEGKKDILLTLHNCKFPREGSLRVNAGESLKEVIYKIDNRRNEELWFKLNVSVHNAEDPSLPKIFEISSIDGAINAFGEKEIEIEEIKFEKMVLDKFMQHGILELRARLICAEDCSEYQKGDKVTSFRQKVYYNCDEKSGKADSFEIKTVDADDKFQRSYLEIGSVRIIFINSAHPAYLSIKDDPVVQRAYLKEQVLKQYTLLYLNERKFGMFDEKFEDLDQITATERIMDKIEHIYFESLNKG